MTEKRTLGVGVIGAGAISGIYLKNMTERFDKLRVVAVAASRLEHAQKRAAEYGLEACTVPALLADPRVELVVVLTPVGTHYDLIRQALLAGKHVYTEKTITDDPAKASQLLALAEERGLYLGAAPDTFLGAAWQTARAAVDSGAIGTVRSFAISANRDLRALLSMFPFLRQPGAGVLYDYGVYYVTALVSLLGPVARVGGIAERPCPAHTDVLPDSPGYGQPIDAPNESRVSAVLQLASGVSGTLHIDGDSIAMDQAYFAIYGSEGILYLSDPNQFGGTVRLLPATVDWDHPARPVELWSFSALGDNARGVGPAEMADAILSGRPARAGKEMACHVLEVLTAVLRGGERGAFVDVASRCERPAAMEPADTRVRNIGHISLQTRDMPAMLHFYGDLLGMRRQFTITVGDFAESLRAQYDGQIPPENAAYLRSMGEDPARPWITYMKLAEGQFLELFWDMDGAGRTVGDRGKNYGYIKCNYETADAAALLARLTEAGASILEGLHTTVDGALEFAVTDPDGNQVQFTQYQAESPFPPLPGPDGDSCSLVRRTTQAAFQVQDGVDMELFYCRGLGLKKVLTLTYGDLARWLRQSGGTDEAALRRLEVMGDRPWIDYIQAAPRQFIELFHTDGQTLREARDLRGAYGYQHICLETADIEAAYAAVLANGLRPDTPISRGADGAYQFWLTDPDGNRLELMEYAPGAMQLAE